MCRTSLHITKEDYLLGVQWLILNSTTLLLFVHVQVHFILNLQMLWMMKVRRKASLCKVTLLTIDQFDQVQEEMYIEQLLRQMRLVEFKTFNCLGERRPTVMIFLDKTSDSRLLHCRKSLF
jgi:hypothetical protein